MGGKKKNRKLQHWWQKVVALEQRGKEKLFNILFMKNEGGLMLLNRYGLAESTKLMTEMVLVKSLQAQEKAQLLQLKAY